MTSAQPYRGRHEAPDALADADDDAALWGLTARAPARARPGSGAVSRPSPPPGLTEALTHQEEVRRSAPAATRADAWVAYTPPHDARPAPPVWEVPAGFVPMKPPRRNAFLRSVVWVAVVAVVGGLAWFGYRVYTQPKPKLRTIATTAATTTYTSDVGHFAVRLPAEPVTSSYSQTFGAYHIEAALAAVPSAREAAAGFTVTPSIPAHRMDEFMQGAINGFARNSRLAHIVTTTYRGHPAITANGTTAENQPVQVLFYASSATHMYLLLAPDPAALRALEARFRPTR